MAMPNLVGTSATTRFPPTDGTRPTRELAAEPHAERRGVLQRVRDVSPQPVPRNAARDRQVIHDVLGDHQSLRTPEPTKFRGRRGARACGAGRRWDDATRTPPCHRRSRRRWTRWRLKCGGSRRPRRDVVGERYETTASSPPRDLLSLPPRMEKGGVEAMVHRVPVLGPRLVVTVVSGGAMMCGDGGAGGGRGKERMGAPLGSIARMMIVMCGEDLIFAIISASHCHRSSFQIGRAHV